VATVKQCYLSDGGRLDLFCTDWPGVDKMADANMRGGAAGRHPRGALLYRMTDCPCCGSPGDERTPPVKDLQ
jgi:hypothetical protein